MKIRVMVIMLAIGPAIAIGSVSQISSIAAAAPKADDDFQLIKVGDGVYAAIAK
jgi:hypothetical protein